MRRIEIVKPHWLPGFRSLVRCYQTHERVAEEHFRKLGITGAQFDILVTLGNTEGMTCRELGEKTLITKGTLTGVIDRLIEKGWVIRQTCEQDRRVVYIRLTDEGVDMFEKVFQPHLDYMSALFKNVSPEVWMQLQRSCEAISNQMQKGQTSKPVSSCGCDGDGI